MPAPVIGRRLRAVPQTPPTIDLSHPVARGVVACCLPVGATFVDVANRAVLTQVAGTAFGADKTDLGASPAITAGASTPRWEWPSATPWLPLGAITVALMHRKMDATNRVSVAFGTYSAASFTGRCNAHLPFSDGNVYWDCGGASEVASGGRLKVASLSGFQASSMWVMTSAGAASEQAIWRNGQLLASVADRGADRVSAGTLCVGNGNSTTTTLNGSDVQAIGFFAVWSRVLSPAEIASFSADPFCFLRY